MKILLVVATDKEVEIDKFQNLDILITGVGILETAYNLTRNLSLNSYDIVINMGIAGSFNPNIVKGDVVEVIEDVISELGYEDDKKFREFKDFNMLNRFSVKGLTDLRKVKSITVNTVHGNKESISKIRRRLNPDIETMEGAAVFRICQNFKTRCIQIRSISNLVEKRKKSDWNLPLAISNLNIEVKKIIDSL